MKKVIFALLLGAVSTAPAHASGFGGLKGALKNLPTNTGSSEQKADKGSTEAAAVNTLLGLVKKESTEEEVAMGQEMAATVLGASKLYPSKNIQNYVNLVGRHIANQSERTELPWTFGVIDADTVNAFAAPGGYIMISKGLYDLLETEDELAAVLGHEIAHVLHKHHFNVIKKQSMVELGVKVAGDKSNQQLAQMATSMAGKMLARGLDKSAEYEADRDGIVLAARAGYDTSAMLKVLDSLELHGQRDRSALSHMFATHPAPEAREHELAKVVNDDIEAAAVLSPAAKRIDKHRK